MIDLFFQKDFANDLFRWIKIYDPIKDHQIVLPNDPLLNQLQQQIIQDGDCAFAYFCAEYFKYNIHLMQRVILDNKNVKYSFAFAKTFPKSDIKALQDILIKSNNIKYLTYFGLFVKGAQIAKIERLLIRANEASNNKYAKYAYLWLKNGFTRDLEAIKSILITSRKPQFLYELAQHLDNPKDIAKIEKAIIKSGSLLYMRLFAANIKLANIKKLERVVLASGNAVEIKRFAKMVKNSILQNFRILF